jgi:hypothetical protein
MIHAVHMRLDTIVVVIVISHKICSGSVRPFLCQMMTRDSDRSEIHRLIDYSTPELLAFTELLGPCIS